MPLVDIIIVVLLALSALIGLMKGFVKEAVSLATWFVAIIVAGIFSSNVSSMLTSVISNASLRDVLAFGLVFIIVIFVGAIVSNLLSKLAKAAGVSSTDRTLGALFGLLRGGVIVLVLLFIAAPFEQPQQWLANSVIVPHAYSLLEYLQSFFDQESAETFAQSSCWILNNHLA